MLLFEYRWELIVVLLLLVFVGVWLSVRRLYRETQQQIDVLTVTNLPRDGYPEHMEAAWEDIGARGRFLTDLGGMSVGMKEQMYEEFLKALNKPIPTIPAAGSINDILCDLDRWLTDQQMEKLSDSEGTE